MDPGDRLSKNSGGSSEKVVETMSPCMKEEERDVRLGPEGHQEVTVLNTVAYKSRRNHSPQADNSAQSSVSGANTGGGQRRAVRCKSQGKAPRPEPRKPPSAALVASPLDPGDRRSEKTSGGSSEKVVETMSPLHKEEKQGA